MITIARAYMEDAETVAKSMTDREREEMHIEFGWSVVSEISYCLHESHEAYTVSVDSTPCLVFGVIRHPGVRAGHMWFIGSKSTYAKNAMEFARASSEVLDDLADTFSELKAYACNSDKKLCRWLGFLGFEKIAEYPESRQSEYLVRF